MMKSMSFKKKIMSASYIHTLILGHITYISVLLLACWKYTH